MSNQMKITKDSVKACLFKEISDTSQETDCPFSAEEIEYFFEHVFPTLDDDDGFYSHYDAAMQMSDKDFEVCFWDFGYANSNEILADISCINYDTKLFHIFVAGQSHDCCNACSFVFEFQFLNGKVYYVFVYFHNYSLFLLL